MTFLVVFIIIAIPLILFLHSFAVRHYVSDFLFLERAFPLLFRYKGKKKAIHIGRKKSDKTKFSNLTHEQIAQMVKDDIRLGLGNLKNDCLYVSVTHCFIVRQLKKAEKERLISDLTVITKTKNKIERAINRWDFKAGFKCFYNENDTERYTKATGGIRYHVSFRVPEKSNETDKI